MLLKGCTNSDEAKWVRLEQTKKPLSTRDEYVLGHSDVSMPAIISTSTLPGVEARLVAVKDPGKIKETTSIPKGAEVTVIKSWKFTEGNLKQPIYFETPKHIKSTFWVEMRNPNTEDAVVNGMIHGLIRTSKV